MEGYTCGEEVRKSKPEPDIFLLAAQKLGVRPEECVVIEDSTAGVRAGLAAGMFTIGYLNPTSDGQDVTPADQVVKHLADAVQVIRERMDA
jgi:beta-phosphoglucomutase-like phosphatase (HAD superfamily)